MNTDVTGVFSAAATPLDADLNVDHARLAAHCRHLIAEGCHGIALLGTTGEANSFSVAERKGMVDALLKSGIRGDQLLPGVGVAAIPDTIELTRHALANGVTRVVMLPPFYYKNVSDDGIFAAYARIIEAVGDDRLRVILYNIPQTSAVPLSQALVTRLVAAFPGIVAGIKDSSGDLPNMEGYAKANPTLSVLAGSDPLMLPLLKAGGAGCITAVSNLAARSLRTIYDNWQNATKAADVEAAHDRLVAWRTLSMSYVQLPAIKTMLAIKTGEDGWRRVRPPLVSLTDTQKAEIEAKLPG